MMTVIKAVSMKYLSDRGDENKKFSYGLDFNINNNAAL